MSVDTHHAAGNTSMRGCQRRHLAAVRVCRSGAGIADAGIMPQSAARCADAQTCWCACARDGAGYYPESMANNMYRNKILTQENTQVDVKDLRAHSPGNFEVVLEHTPHEAAHEKRTKTPTTCP
jgi:hypothetical protein